VDTVRRNAAGLKIGLHASHKPHRTAQHVVGIRVGHQAGQQRPVNPADTVVVDALPVLGPGLVVRHMDADGLPVRRQVADLFGEGVVVAVARPVNKPNGRGVGIVLGC
jgi:hypothetical protein